MGMFDKKISPEEFRARLGLVGPGYTAAARRFEGIKAREVVRGVSSDVIIVGKRYIPAPHRLSNGIGEGEAIWEDIPSQPTVVTSMSGIERSIAGWKMAFSYLGVKAGERVAIVKRKVGESAIGLGYGTSLVIGKAGEGVGKIGESFGNVRSSFESIKWWLLIPILILLFIAIMVSIGYSGLGAPAARVAEREHARVR